MVTHVRSTQVSVSSSCSSWVTQVQASWQASVLTQELKQQVDVNILLMCCAGV